MKKIVLILFLMPISVVAKVNKKSVIVSESVITMKITNALERFECGYRPSRAFDPGGWSALFDLDKPSRVSNNDFELGLKNVDTVFSKTEMRLWDRNFSWQTHPNSCGEIENKLKDIVNSNGDLELLGKRTIRIETGLNNWIIIEGVSAQIKDIKDIRGESLVLSKELFINTGFEVQKDINSIHDFVGERFGLLDMHPQAVSEHGFQCVPSNPEISYVKFTSLKLGANTERIFSISKFNVGRIFMGSGPYDYDGFDECLVKRQSLLEIAKRKDPNNRGIIVEAKEEVKLLDKDNGERILLIKQKSMLYGEKLLRSAAIIL